MANFEAHFAGFHPLQADEDASPEALMLARSRAALAWGRLQGLVAHLEPGCERTKITASAAPRRFA